MGFLYMLHYERPLSDRHPRFHYLGYADENPERRIKQHRRGQAGAVFTTEAHRLGIAFSVAQIWPNMTKEDERRVKRMKSHRRYCSLCTTRVARVPPPVRIRNAPKCALEGSGATVGANVKLETGAPKSGAPDESTGDDMLKAMVIGNLGNDPELRYNPAGNAFLRFNVASNFSARRADGEWEDRVEWVQVTVFGKRGETLAGYLKKGMRVYADGRLEARPWTDRENNVRAGLQIVASDVEFAQSREDSGDRQETRMPGQPANRGRQTTSLDDDDGLEDLPF